MNNIKKTSKRQRCGACGRFQSHRKPCGCVKRVIPQKTRQHAPKLVAADQVKGQRKSGNRVKGRMLGNFNHTPKSFEAPNLFDVINEGEFEEALREEYLYVREHEKYPYLLIAHHKTLGFKKVWNGTTLACRGMVVDKRTKKIVARPFKKFFNHGQDGAPSVALDDNVVVYDKVDGSLGILVPKPNRQGYIITTKGGWDSEQAEIANTIWGKKYSHLQLNPNLTYMYEIVSPRNRIVVNYEDMEDLILLGAVDIKTGISVPIEQAKIGWVGPTVEQFPYQTYREVFEAPPRENAEGFVVWHPSTDERVKVKQQDYLKMHALVTELSTKRIWETLRDGKIVSEELANTPDEFYEWVKQKERKLLAEHEKLKKGLREEHEEVHKKVIHSGVSVEDKGVYMKTFASIVKNESYNPLTLLVARGVDVDGPKISQHFWRELRPVGEDNLKWF